MSMTKIATVTVGAGDASSIDFQGIPQTFSDLYLVASIRNSGTYEHVLIGLNGSTANFSGRYLSGYGNSGQKASSTYARYLGNTSRNGYTANTFGATTIYIPNYTSANNKSITADSCSENNSTTDWGAVVSVNTWAQTAAITSLQLTNEAGAAILEGSTATLYGIKDVTKAAKATGGTITSDGAYIYHTFTASGNFTPTTALNAELLMVAGGGGSRGGSAQVAGGGGAGGLLYVANSSFTAGTYPVVIGAGGSGANGSDSTINGFTAIGGGASGYSSSTAGATNGSSGGSGGGASSYNNTSGTGGAGTAGQGFAGGGVVGGASYGDGGGGAGQVAPNGDPGVGGNGLSSYSAWCAGANVGQDISGTYWLAGGGGGGGAGGPGPFGGIGGNGGGGTGGGYSGATGNVNPTSGLANTGGGGGGANTGYCTPGSGGSGVIIVRYLK